MRIRKDYQEYRKKPYVARWYEGRRQRNKFFATESAREEFIEQFGKTAQQADPALPTIDPHRLIRWQQAIAFAPDADPVEVFKFWVSEQKKLRKLGERYLGDATSAYINSMERIGRNKSYIGHVRRTLTDLEAEFGNRLVREFTADEIRDYLFGLPYSPITIRNKRTYFQGAFSWWDKQGWLSDNPMTRVESPKVQDKEPEILSVPEIRSLFSANEKVDPEICGLLALGAFAGMRSSAISRIDYAEIDFKQRGILTPAEKTKKNRRQWIEDLPDNLWEWLKKTPPQAFEMTQRQMLHRRAQAFKRAGLLVEADDISRENAKRDRKGLPASNLKPKCPPKNALRHSFVTYHVALHRNPGKTALIVSHRDQDCLYQHYLGIANKQDAERYFRICPRM
ncbi:MAG: tyrosine-type recombinase/integrase [Puniceicoccaceae bacterium]